MMPISVGWADISARLALTMLCCGVIGLNRGAGGHAAGLRTTILVGLAAAVAMIQTNILLPLAGKTPESFSVMDLMRLPLGILTGVGFIGGGAILKKGDLIAGITTAATMWLVTVIGLCLGGGQTMLGIVTTGLAVFTLWVLKWVDEIMPREHHAKLTISADPHGAPIDRLGQLFGRTFDLRLIEKRQTPEVAKTDYVFDLSWRAPGRTALPDETLAQVEYQMPIRAIEIITDSAG